MPFINIADLTDPTDGRTYRQINAAKSHEIPIGTLVELKNGARLFVVHHDRDCDETPLYYLSADSGDTQQVDPLFRNPGWTSGYSADSLRVVAK